MQTTLLNTRLFVFFSLLPWLVAVFFKIRPWLQILQLAGYKGHEYWDWLKGNHRRVFTTQGLAELGFIILAGTAASWLPSGAASFGSLIVAWVALQLVQIIKPPQVGEKKKLVFTPRVWRLVISFALVVILEVLFLLWLSFPDFVTSVDWLHAELISSAWFFSLLQAATLLNPLTLWLANALVHPLEKHISQRFFDESRAIIKQHPQLKVIGITGSYGKTSTKYILNSLLASKYLSLMTPESYNTPMGICKVIRGELKSFHQFFVVEMGARYRGDIQELCRLSPPQMGILTAIGPQHLKTFGSLEAIVATKRKLLRALPSDGVAVINNDDEHCRQMAQSADCKCLRYGLKDKQHLDIWAEDISSGPQGTNFTLRTKDGQKTELRTPLLGKHNVYNILAASCAALYWEVPLKNIAAAVAKLEPVPHRLQLLKGEGDISVIDDAFNSNPAGAAVALEVLKSFPHGRKFLVTPGMIELGAEEFEENKKLGKLAAGACDFVILVGPKRTVPIAEGLKEAGFAQENLFIEQDLAAARQTLGKLIQPGDVVLFENDLPDNYNEE